MMEGTAGLVSVARDAAAQLEAVLLQEAALWDTGDLFTMERRLQQVFRRVGSDIVSGVLAQRAAGPEGEAVACPACGHKLHLVGRERARTVLGLVGEYRVARPTFHCAACHAGHAPLDAVLGLGDERLSPGLAQVVCEQAQKDAFAAASVSVERALGVFVAAETVRRVAEDVGRLVEHDQRDRTRWAVPATAVPTCLVVEIDGVHTPLRDGYHETKVGRVAVLGPRVRTDPETGRTSLVLHTSTFCTGLEPVEDFLPRLYREAVRAGFGRGVRQVVLLGDGATWILPRLVALFAQPGVEVIPIVDFFHAAEHLAEVASALYGAGTLQARTWLAAQRHALVHQGPAPLLATLAACTGLDEAAAEVVRRNRDYFAIRATCLDYPRCIARQLPIGSGAVESACKTLITQREKGTGMRWAAPGAQHIAQLRALAHSAHARWDVFWASRPLARLRLLPPLAAPAVPPAADAAPTTLAATAAPPAAVADPPADTPPPPAGASRIVSTGKPWGKGKGYWGRVSLKPARSA
jgi:hypothetical protein